MESIIEVIPLDDYKVKVKFADNFSAEVDIKPFIRGGISDALKDKSFFQNVKVDDFNGISWDNGFDFCPNFLREYIESNRKKSNAEDNDINKVADN